jgi:drug/metabolite transporter (DMT)-like permease
MIETRHDRADRPITLLGPADRSADPTQPSLRNLQTISAFFLIYIVWGTTFYAIRDVVATVPPFLSAALRFLAAGSILVAFALIRGQFRIGQRQLLNAAAISLMMFLIGYGGLFWSEKRIDSGIAALLVATIPVWIALMEIFVLRKGRLHAPLLVAIALGVAGVGVLTLRFGQMSMPIRPVIVLTVGQIAWALGSVLSKKLSLPESKVVTAGVQMFIGGVALAVCSIASGELVNPVGISRQAALALLYLAIPGSVVAFTAYIWLLGRVSPTIVGSYAYVNPVVALIIGYALGNEAIGVRTLIGSMLVVSSVILTLTFSRPAQK